MREARERVAAAEREVRAQAAEFERAAGERLQNLLRRARLVFEERDGLRAGRGSLPCESDRLRGEVPDARRQGPEMSALARTR